MLKRLFLAALAATAIVGLAHAQQPAAGRMSSAIVPNNTTGVLLKGGSGFVYSIQVGGIGAAPAYLKLYDKATAPTCGTDTPVKRLIIPAASTAANGEDASHPFPFGIRFELGIGYCVTTGIADNDTTAPAASTFIVNIDWR